MIKIKQENWEWTDIDKLKTDGLNPNRMTNKQKEALKNNIEKFGFNMPIITDKDYLIADGEQKLMVAKEMNIKKVPVLRKDINNTERRIIRQSMNKLRGSHKPDLDREEYKAILEDIDSDHLSSLTSISDKEIKNALKEEEKELKIIQKVEQLGHLTIKCPKCGHKFQRKD